MLVKEAFAAERILLLKEAMLCPCISGNFAHACAGESFFGRGDSRSTAPRVGRPPARPSPSQARPKALPLSRRLQIRRQTVAPTTKH